MAITRQETTVTDYEIEELQAARAGCELLAGMVTVRNAQLDRSEKLPFAHQIDTLSVEGDPELSLMMRSLTRGEQ